MSNIAKQTKKSSKVAVNADDAAAVLTAVQSYWAGTGNRTSEQLTAAIETVLAGKKLEKGWADAEPEEDATDDEAEKVN